MAARENRRGVTLAEIKRSWPPTVNVEDGARAYGVSRATAYASIADGTFPAATIKVRGRLKVLTASLIESLEGRSRRESA